MTIVLKVYEGYIHVVLDVNDGRVETDQIGVALKYDPSGAMASKRPRALDVFQTLG